VPTGVARILDLEIRNSQLESGKARLESDNAQLRSDQGVRSGPPSVAAIADGY
jgi:hypothetical protein